MAHKTDVLILPFVDLKDLDYGDYELCQPCDDYLSFIEIQGKPGKKISRFIMNQLGDYPAINAIPWENSTEHGNLSTRQIKNILKQVFPPSVVALEWDFIITGLVLRYKKRQGNAFSAWHPASIAYYIYFIPRNAINGDIAKNYVYKIQKTQPMPPSGQSGEGHWANLSGRWLTVDELAMLSINDALQRWPLLPQKSKGHTR